MALLAPFSTADKTSHNSHKFGFTLSPTNYGFWKNLIKPFLVTNNLFGYIDASIPCPPKTIPPANDKDEPQPNRRTSRDLWLSLERAYAPPTSSRVYTLKTQLMQIKMKGDETASAYLTRAQSLSDSLANIGHPMAETDLVLVVIAGLREEYNGLKSTLLTRQFPTVFSELHGLLADHDYLITKNQPDVNPTQAFAATTINRNTTPAPGASTAPSDTLHALQQLTSQLGLQLQPASTSNQPPQALYTTRSFSRGRGNRRGGRGGNQNSSRNSVGNRSQFSWASNQNTVYGTCNRCGIGHIPSQCPNRDPATVRTRQPSANYADYRSQASTSTWLPDTGSSNHVSPDFAGFEHSEPYFGDDNLHVGNGTPLPILHIGSTRLYSPSKTFSLHNILHVPEIKTNLLSVQKFCQDNNVFFEFHATFFLVKDKSTRATLLMGPSNGGLYSFRFPKDHPIKKVAFSTIRASSTIWHQRLGHPHPQLFASMISKYCLPVLNNDTVSPCNACSIGKSSKPHLFPSNYKSTHVLDLVFCDVWGPAPVASFDGHKYFLLCVDHFTRFMWIFPLKYKSDVFSTFTNFINMAERQFQTTLKSVQTDEGGCSGI
ncbi:hypothetical protein E3N88_15920 [Mikania micrantha]|uniref:Uncharacterized protein n=1 Tax=Mikania micrantha TaxID=192012 RepID=A0A5N6NWS5_9ASTR|nr:hypothetical protein E3N88_15920 [Mikania micrantha]